MKVEVKVDYKEARKATYPTLEEQLDMLYWDKVNGTEEWKKKIERVKTTYPKDN